MFPVTFQNFSEDVKIFTFPAENLTPSFAFQTQFLPFPERRKMGKFEPCLENSSFPVLQRVIMIDRCSTNDYFNKNMTIKQFCLESLKNFSGARSFPGPRGWPWYRKHKYFFLRLMKYIMCPMFLSLKSSQLKSIRYF